MHLRVPRLTIPLCSNSVHMHASKYYMDGLDCVQSTVPKFGLQ